MAMVLPDRTLPGGLLQLAQPWRGDVAAEIAAAESRRDGWRERVEDVLVAAQADGRAARELLREARVRWHYHAEPTLEATAAVWYAVRARYALGQADVGEWADALAGRVGALVSASASRADVARGALDFLELCGPSGPRTVPESESDPDPEEVQP